VKYPAAPVKYTRACQLSGLEQGEFMIQPKWDGRRAIKFPGESLLYKSGKPVDAKPWSKLQIPNVDVPLDLELMRDRAIVIDLIISEPFSDRLKKMNELGLDHMAMEINSVDAVNKMLRTCLTSGLCDGVVLKRLNSGYPIGSTGQINFEHWVKVKELI
jgi:ATP-dependent DNA ligase